MRRSPVMVAAIMPTVMMTFAAWLALATSPAAFANPSEIRERGKTLVEAEHFRAVSDPPPKIEPSRQCSGQSNLEYFWANAWFELELKTARMLNYRVSIRAASAMGTKIAIASVDGADAVTSLAMIDVPDTGEYTDYEMTAPVIVTLPAGVQRLRFTNQSEGVNVDFVTFSAGSFDDVVTVQPIANEGPDINPLKGFNTRWWRNEDYASVGFQYIEWGRLEPQDDFLDWDYVEKEVRNREGTRGRHIILQFVVDWDWREPVDANYLGPDWLREKTGEFTGTADPDDPDSRPMRAMPYNDDVFIGEAIEAIEALCEHYNDDPRTFVIQVGVLGFGGEWHTFPREDWAPNASTKRTILNTYLKSLGADGLTQVRYPDESVNVPRKGMGDTNGSATLTDHGREFGDAIARRQLWKNGPVGGEWPPNVETQFWQRFFMTDDGEQLLRTGHYTTMLPPEPKEITAKLSDWKQDGAVMKMHRLMGYNFQATAVRHLISADGSGLVHIEVDLHNAGTAPFYKDWTVQLAVIRRDSGDVVSMVHVDTDLRTLGESETITIAGACDAPLAARVDYQIGLRIVPIRGNISTLQEKLQALPRRRG